MSVSVQGRPWCRRFCAVRFHRRPACPPIGTSRQQDLGEFKILRLIEKTLVKRCHALVVHGIEFRDGMKQLPKRSGEFLFEIIVRRHEIKSTLMTSNRPLEDCTPSGSAAGVLTISGSICNPDE